MRTGTGTAATFWQPTGVAVDSAGNVYVADESNNEIRMITPAGAVTLLAGSPTGVAGNHDATGTSATFSAPAGIAIDSQGNLWVADSGNNEIRENHNAGRRRDDLGGQWHGGAPEWQRHRG